MKNEIEKCTSQKQLYRILKKYGKSVIRDEQKDGHTDYFSIWIDDDTRIYKPYHRKTFVMQTVRKVSLNYSGIPVFFG